MSENTELKPETWRVSILKFGIQSIASPAKKAIAAYLTDILAAGDLNLFNSALADVARSIGMGRGVEYAGLTREGLYKTLRPVSKPRFETIASVLTGLGLAIRLVPLEGETPER